ncbi:MAG: anti-sigma factor [Ilumatobacteraceae bacterium]
MSDDDDQVEFDELRDLLDNPALWADPPADLESRVVAAIAAERDARPSSLDSTSRPVPAALRVPPRRRSRRLLVAAVGLAAAIAIAVGVAVSIAGRSGGGEHFAFALSSPTGVGTVEGHVKFTRTTSGWRIQLDAAGLPRLDNGRFYEAWMRNDAGTLVPIGTFNESRNVVLWSGVSPRDYPTLTVTEEKADGNQATSGQRVLTGMLTIGG